MKELALKSADERRVGIFRCQPGAKGARQVDELRGIVAYYENNDQLVSTLVEVATQKFGVSQRLMDYYCTNFAKKFGVVTVLKTSYGPNAVHVFSLYKDWLRHYRRRSFDPFRRRERVLFEHPHEPGTLLETTVAQLNFLRWADMYGIIEHMRQNLALIESDMLTSLRESKARRQNMKWKGRKTRMELNAAPSAKCTVYIINNKACSSFEEPAAEEEEAGCMDPPTTFHSDTST